MPLPIRSRIQLLLPVLVLLFGLLVGAHTGLAQSGPSMTLTIGIDADPPNLDPYLSTARVDRYVQNSIFDKLYDIDEHMNIVPVIAAELPDISEDGTVYTIPLRQGIQFHDGTVLDADAVVYNLNRYISPSSMRAGELASVASVEKVDDYTVRLHLKVPFAPLLMTLTDRAGMIGSPTAIEAAGEDFALHPVGSGPFVYVSRIKGDQIVLEKNENYWQAGLPKADRVVWKAIPDENVKVLNLQSGQLDVINTIPARQVPQLQSDPRFQVVMASGLGFQGFFLNVNNPPFDNPDLRRAFSAAIDRTILANVVFGDTAEPAFGPFSPSSPVSSASGQVPPADVERAKEFLARAGKPDGFRFTLSIAARTADQQIAQVVQQMVAGAGIDMQIRQMEFGTLIDTCDKLDYEGCYLGWSGRPDPDGNIFSWLHTTGPNNYARYSDGVVDELLEQARIVSDMAERERIYGQVLDIVHDQVPYVYLYFEKDLMAHGADVEGFVLYPDGIIRPAAMSKN